MTGLDSTKLVNLYLIQQLNPLTSSYEVIEKAFHLEKILSLSNEEKSSWLIIAREATEEVKIVAAQPQFATHVKAAEDFYGINRIELKNVRYSVFRTFRLIKKMHEKLTIEGNDEPFRKEVKKQIEDMLSNKYLFAGMNRYFDNKL